MRKKFIQQRVSYFRRWTRKKYTAFNSIHKVVLISTISLTCSFLAKPTTGIAQPQSDSVSIPLPQVEITTDELPLDATLPLMLLENSVSKKDIDRSAAKTLNELLDLIPQLDIRQRGFFGVQADISYRGGTFDQTKVLLNGINFTDPQTGHYSLNMPVPNDIIQRIDLYKSTVSSFAGTINIVTDCDTASSYQLHLMGGMYGLFHVQSDINFQTRKFSHLLSLDYSQSDGYIKNTDFQITNLFYQTRGHFKTGNLEFQMGYTDKNYGANGFYSLKFPDQYEQTETFLTSIRWLSTANKLQIIPALYYRLNRDCFELIKGQNPTKNNYHLNQVMGVNVQSILYSRWGKSSANAEIRIEDVKSSSLGNLLTQPIQSLFPNIDYRFGRTRTIVNLSVAHDVHIRRFSANVALFAQYLTDFPDKIYLLPTLNVSYDFHTKNTCLQRFTNSLFLAFSSTLRNPTFTDLYYKTGDIIGNTNLLPERAYTAEIGHNFKIFKQQNELPYFTLSMAVYSRYGVDMIDFVKKENDAKWQSINHTNILFTGIEVGIQLLPPQIRNRNFWIESFGINYNYLYSNKETDDWQSMYVLDHLTHRLNVHLCHKIVKGLRINYDLSYNQRKGKYSSYSATMGTELKNFPDYVLLDIRVSYQIKIFDLYVEVSNILNYKYFDIGGLIQPGVWVRAGVKIKNVF